MLSAKSIFEEIRTNDQAFQMLMSMASKGEYQGGWENERIANLTQDPEFAQKIRRHGEDETKHGRMFESLLKKRNLETTEVSLHQDYCMQLENQNVGLAHARLKEERPLGNEELLKYLVHSRVTEQRAAEEVALQWKLFGHDPELRKSLEVISDDEVNHLSFCHEELLRFAAMGFAQRIRDMLKRYAHAENVVYREVGLAFVDKMAGILGWGKAKQGLMKFGIHANYLIERVWRWRRMVTLKPPVRPNALGPKAESKMAVNA